MARDLQRLMPKHFRILELAVRGWSRGEIAGEVGMTPEGTGLVMNSPRFQDELARRREVTVRDANEGDSETLTRARGMLEDASVDAADTQIKLLSAEDERVQLSSAKDILDRVMPTATKDAPTIVIKAENINVLTLALRESDVDRQEGEAIEPA